MNMEVDHKKILSLLGLCLRGSNLVIGEAPVENAVRSRKAKLVLIASDAADNTARRAGHFAEIGACPLMTVPAVKTELGHALGRASVAMAAVTDSGLAATVIRRLTG